MKTITVDEAKAIHAAELARITARGVEAEPVEAEARKAARTMIHAKLQEANLGALPPNEHHGRDPRSLTTPERRKVAVTSDLQKHHFAELWDMADALVSQVLGEPAPPASGATETGPLEGHVSILGGK